MMCSTGKFSVMEQVWMQVSFHGIWITGAISICSTNPFFAILYLLFVTVGIFYLIQHLWICPRYPHIKDHSACVQLPPLLTKKLIKKKVIGHLNLYEKIGFFVVLYGVIAIPLYWVLDFKYLRIPYLTFGLTHYFAYYVHFCKKCLNMDCPQNMNKGIQPELTNNGFEKGA